MRNVFAGTFSPSQHVDTRRSTWLGDLPSKKFGILFITLADILPKDIIKSWIPTWWEPQCQISRKVFQKSLVTLKTASGYDKLFFHIKFDKKMDSYWSPWIGSIAGSLLVGLSGVVPLLFIPDSASQNPDAFNGNWPTFIFYFTRQRILLIDIIKLFVNKNRFLYASKLAGRRNQCQHPLVNELV